MMKYLLYFSIATIVIFLSGCISIPEKTSQLRYSDGKISTNIDSGKCNISIDGDITEDLPSFISTQINDLKNQNCLQKTLIINSRGGISSAAQKIGQLVRLNNFDTAIRYENQCSSACGLIFISGVNRIIWKPNFLHTNQPRIGFHAPATKNDGACMHINRIDHDKRVKAAIINIFQYAESMLGRKSALQFTANMFDTDCKELKFFSIDKLLEQGIVTRMGELGRLYKINNK